VVHTCSFPPSGITGFHTFSPSTFCSLPLFGKTTVLFVHTIPSQVTITMGSHIYAFLNQGNRAFFSSSTLFRSCTSHPILDDSNNSYEPPFIP
jgi:hypothetical protein